MYACRMVDPAFLHALAFLAATGLSLFSTMRNILRKANVLRQLLPTSFEKVDETFVFLHF